jgi:hypothetical protein
MIPIINVFIIKLPDSTEFLSDLLRLAKNSGLSTIEKMACMIVCEI